MSVQRAAAGAAVKFSGGSADALIRVCAIEPVPEFLDFTNEGRTELYRHAARPTGKSPYHIYRLFIEEDVPADED